MNSNAKPVSYKILSRAELNKIKKTIFMVFECFIWSKNPVGSVAYSIVAREISVIQYFVEYHYLKKIKLSSTGLRIYLVDNKDEARMEKPIKGVYPLLNYYMYFDFEHYFNLTDNYEKKKVIIAMFKEGIYRAAEFMSWNTDPLLDAFNLIDALDYTFVNVTKRKRFKGVKKFMQIETVCEPGFYHYYLLVKEKEELLSRHKIVTLNAFYNLFWEHNRIVSEARWEDANTFVIVGQKGHLERIRFEYKLDTDKLTQTFNLEPDLNKEEFMEEYDMATTTELSKIENFYSNFKSSKWHIYL